MIRNLFLGLLMILNTSDVFPVFYAIAGESVIGAFNSGLNYYNANWLNATPFIQNEARWFFSFQQND